MLYVDTDSATLNDHVIKLDAFNVSWYFLKGRALGGLKVGESRFESASAHLPSLQLPCGCASPHHPTPTPTPSPQHEKKLNKNGTFHCLL